MLFQHEKVSEPRLLRGLKYSFAVCGPKIGRISESFLDSIIEIVSKTADLRFHFDHGDQQVAGEDDEVPLFAWSIEARQRSRPLFGHMDLNVWQRCIFNDRRDKPYESIGMLAAGDRASFAGISLSRLAALVLFLFYCGPAKSI